MNNTPTEYQECVTLVHYLTLKNVLHTHIHNEMYTKSWKQKKKAKDLGVSSGFPDYFIFVPKERSKTKKAECLLIEMKRKKGGTVSKNQKEWLENLATHDELHVAVCKGFDEAKEFCDLYIL